MSIEKDRIALVRRFKLKFLCFFYKEINLDFEIKMNNENNLMAKFLDDAFAMCESTNGVVQYSHTTTTRTAVPQAAISTHPQASNAPALAQTTTDTTHRAFVAVQNKKGTQEFLKFYEDKWNKFLQDPTRPQDLVLDNPNLTAVEEFSRRKHLMIAHELSKK